MTETSNVKLTIAFNDPDLDSEELEEQAQNLLAQMRDLDDIETVDRALAPNPLAENKAVGTILVGLPIQLFLKEIAFIRTTEKPILRQTCDR